LLGSVGGWLRLTMPSVTEVGGVSIGQ